MAITHGFGNQFGKFGIHGIVGKALPKVDGFVLCGEGTHYRKNGGTYRGKF
jgi:hypothetical protein